MRTLFFLGFAILLSSCSSINIFGNRQNVRMSVVHRLPHSYQMAHRSLSPMPEFGHTSYMKPENFVLSYKPVAQLKSAIDDGKASWYGPNFHGNLTANGERYDMHELTAAHPSLPFNTKVWVENKDNGRMVLVRINDRGPYAHNRIIDLSKAAAEKLDMIGTGVASVKLYPVSSHWPVDNSTDPDLSDAYTIQLAKFKAGSKAFAYAQTVDNSRVEVIEDKNSFVYGVFYGLYQSQNQAFGQLRKLDEDSRVGLVKQRGG